MQTLVYRTKFKMQPVAAEITGIFIPGITSADPVLSGFK
jgi:hypothetical protein